MIARGKGGLQQRTIKRTGWTVARRRIFLDMLATTCNVTAATKAAGMSTATAHALRRRDAEFALLWAKAIAEGRERLKERLLAHSLALAPSEDHPGDLSDEPPPAAFDAGTALKTLQTLAALDRASGGRGERPDYATEAEVNALLMERLTAMARKLGKA